MTGANIFNLGKPEVGNVNAVAARGDKNKAATEEAAAVFASMMNQSAGNMQMAEPENTDLADVSNTAVDSSPSNEAYDRYQYKQNTVEKSENPSVSDKIDSAKEELDGFEEDVVTAISEKLNVSAEDVQKALEDLGLTVFDLLNPKNLAVLAAQLTNTADTTELLMNADFQELLGDIGQMGSDLMKQLGIPMDQMDEFVMQMDQMDQMSRMDESVVQADAPDADSAGNAEAAVQDENGENVLNQPIAEEANASAAKDSDKSKEQKIIVEDLRDADSKEDASTLVKAVEADEKESPTMDFSKSENGNKMMPDGQQVMQQNVEQALRNDNSAQPISYTDIDVFDMIEQVARNVRVVLETDVSTMEMQLNPENLGKIYLHVSSKEGTVHAQIAAQNEIVKEALEMQIATLRENLSQAGVKVDAVEVTVASHEFERNLEQNEQGQGQNQDNEEKRASRRNLNLDSLDELSGLMSEEEALVAQIMKDNGNSVDFTA